MRRLFLPAVLLVLLLVMGLLVASALEREPAALGSGGTVRVEQVDTHAYPQVTLYVSVRDAAGQLDPGLRQADFRLYEDGVPVELEAFAGAGDGTVTSLLVLDRSGSMRDDHKIEGAREAAHAFIALMRPEDQAALMVFDSRVALLQAFTNDQAALSAAVDRVRATGATALYDAIVAGVAQLEGVAGRRLLVVLSDGEDCREANNCSAYAGSQHSLNAAIEAAQAANQPVTVIGLGDRTSGSGIDEVVLQRIAAETGGNYFYAPDGAELAQLYTNLADEVQHEYRLRYLSPRPFYDGTRRDLRILAGTAQTTAGYTERHLINVVAQPLVGVVLLTPLLLLLLLPGVRARRSSTVMPVSAEAKPDLVEEQVAASEQCPTCMARLRAGAKFCPQCGAGRLELPSRRSFCAMCGRPLSDDGTFCMHCGEPVAQRRKGP